MKKQTHSKLLFPFGLLLLGAVLTEVGSFSQTGGESAATSLPNTFHFDSQDCRMALLPHAGGDDLDRQIRDLQAALPEMPRAWQGLERLGWLFVSKARSGYDPGYYTLAQASARCLQEAVGSRRLPAAMLLRGHVLHSLHKFQQAEALARDLVEVRGASYDFGLLGDVLQDQGKIQEAAQAYQHMADLKPGPKAYSRAAHIRWVLGDLEGAVELMTAAATAGERSPEAAAWAFVRLGWYQLQAGQVEGAQASALSAETLRPGYAPALLLRGRVLLAQGKESKALQMLQRAAALNPLPEYAWALADALRIKGQALEADELERALVRNGVSDDPRTLALFLATRQREAEKAVRLAREELEARQDVFTYDALAWALHRAGRGQDARDAMRQALSLNTRDGRLFLHAGLIFGGHDSSRAAAWLRQAHEMRQTLLPSEIELLDSALGNPNQPDFVKPTSLGE
ncbi:MAG TPA: hypothetical protein VLU25_19965 [Acidobacteriota bacterium]|nr:hypothetical protein [Acidobacteriota bacterium]